jgi:hypothetical protein
MSKPRLGPADAWTEDGTYAVLRERSPNGSLRVLVGFWTWTGDAWAAGNRRPITRWLRGKDAVSRSLAAAADYVREHPGHNRFAPDQRSTA